jgi:threonyl-tRNA synthetase
VSAVKVVLDGNSVELESGADGFKLFSDKTVVAMRVNEELKDLAHKLANGDVVEAVHISSPDGLNILRHSAAHVLAQAVQNINPEAKLGIGPPI